ncbi:MAG TPA: shikimate dehydrogenase [Casimicrobiaceae bacterium]|jgi:shikimate dehydrogenase|nr:shikimate dehydrogenase [Casimicrobiaceae bacterium]
MPDKYAVIGNPIAHSKSPIIQMAFARATHQDMVYDRLLAPLDGFRATVERFAAEGGMGLNVTAPFKREAFEVAASTTERAKLAGAVNTLRHSGGAWQADNTDGVGLTRDLFANLHVDVRGLPVAILGAGGAVRGIVKPLFDAGAASITVINRTLSKAETIAAEFSRFGKIVAAAPVAHEDPHPVVINATSIGVGGVQVAEFPFDPSVIAPGSFAYDLIYSDTATPFMRWARAHGAARTSDGMGMLIEQAAESFALWRGVRPETRAVFELLRPGA